MDTNQNSNGGSGSGNPRLDRLYQLWGPPVSKKAREAREFIAKKKVKFNYGEDKK